MIRLNLGAGRFDVYVKGRAVSKLKFFTENCDSWIHLGEDVSKLGKDEFYKKFDYRSWFYKRGDSLPFGNNKVGFICAEHFFEHLFLADAAILMEECARVLQPGGVIRIICPDLFRMDCSPEPHGLGTPRNIPLEQSKAHKIRWSAYSLEEALFSARLITIPIRYWDRFGKHCKVVLKEVYKKYNVSDKESVFSFDYINRLNSVIVDGLKER